jgi:hypothetical protein
MRGDLAAGVDIEANVDAAEFRRIEADLELIGAILRPGGDGDGKPGDWNGSRRRSGRRSRRGGRFGSRCRETEVRYPVGGCFDGAAACAARFGRGSGYCFPIVRFKPRSRALVRLLSLLDSPAGNSREANRRGRRKATGEGSADPHSRGPPDPKGAWARSPGPAPGHPTADRPGRAEQRLCRFPTPCRPQPRLRRRGRNRASPVRAANRRAVVRKPGCRPDAGRRPPSPRCSPRSIARCQRSWRLGDRRLDRSAGGAGASGTGAKHSRSQRLRCRPRRCARLSLAWVRAASRGPQSVFAGHGG